MSSPKKQKMWKAQRDNQRQLRTNQALEFSHVKTLTTSYHIFATAALTEGKIFKDPSYMSNCFPLATMMISNSY